MASRQCSGEGSPSVWKTRSGRLCYPTSEGIAVFDPSVPPDAGSPYGLRIESMQANDDPVDFSRPVRLSRGVNDITLKFTQFFYRAPAAHFFTAQLLGYDEAPLLILPYQKREVRYRNLPPGRYRFVVKSATADPKGTTDEAELKFRIEKPILMQPVLLIGLSLLLLLAVISPFIIAYRRKSRLSGEKYKTSSLSTEQIKAILPKLTALLEENKRFLDPNLTLITLASELHIHPNHLSRIINEHFKMGYNDFVNRYRIEEIKRRFADPEWKDKTILEIMYETGFYSKSVFNTAFKKFTRMTPTQYRKQNT
jgi:AraC-like DNA-binding protein